MKTQLLVLALITSVFTTQIQGQNRTIVNANNSEISDNLDLRVVASIFGDSKNLYDFERRLNDPELQISNLDLNNDNQVDYLRVIESVEKRTHLIIIQSVLDRDLYQDVATIEVEKDKYNDISIQVVGNTYIYGQNYIYEPVYYSAPYIYASFWTPFYRSYYSSWFWGNYPSNYYAWNPYPIYRYRNNVNYCLNIYNYNHYNYVNYRSSNYAKKMYRSIHSNGYEKQYPEYSFSRRNSNVNNRYDLDQIRNTRNIGSRNEIGYSQNKTNYPSVSAPQRTESKRGYSQNRTEYSKVNTPNRTETQRNYSQNRTESQSVNVPQRTESQRNYSQNRTESQSVNVPQRTESQRNYSQNRTESQRTESQRNYSQNRTESQSVNVPQRTESQRNYSQNRTESQRNYSQNRTESPKVNTPSRTESQRGNSQNRAESSAENNNSSRNSNRRT